MQPHPMTSVMQRIVTVAAVAVASCAIIFTVWTVREHRNADLAARAADGALLRPKCKRSAVAYSATIAPSAVASLKSP